MNDHTGIPEAERADAARTADACAVESAQRLMAGGFGRDCEDLHAEFKAAVECLSGGTNTVLLDDAGMPSVMVRVDRMALSELMDSAAESPHPAFVAGGKPVDAIYYSKYQNIVCRGRGYSLPLKDPQTYVSFDEARAYCAAKGPGWGLTPYALRAALALWARRNGTMPRGNNNGGYDIFHPEEAGWPTEGGRVATGSGPISWSHNGRLDGIFDLNGNMNEWDDGLRVVDGEIQIVPGALCMLAGASITADSALWRAILSDGTLVPPGTAGTLRYRGHEGGIRLTTSSANEPGRFNCAFHAIRSDEGVAVPELLKALALYPETEQDTYGGWRWLDTKGECMPICGGAHRAVDHAGVFFMGLTFPRTHKYELSGFRCAYLPQVAE